MKFNTYSKMLALLALVCPLTAHSYPGESISRDSVTGDYIITYWNTSMEPPGLETTVFVPSTKIDPELRSRFYVGGNNSIVYRYSIRNGNQAKQILGLIIFDPVESIIGTTSTRGMKRGTAADAKARIAVMTANEAALSTPTGWNGSIVFGSGARTNSSIRASWGSSSELSTGIKPGNEVRGFGYSSLALPDIIVAELSGDAPVHGWSGEGPPEDSAIIPQLREIESHDFVPRPAAVPTIAVPEPFDAAVLLDRVRTHFLTWQGKQLVEPAFSSQLDRYLVAAAETFRRNQIKAGKEHLETIHEMLEKEHKHLDGDDEGDAEKQDKEHRTVTHPNIDRLAARVLDFDLKYVLKRLEPVENDRKK